MPQLSPSDLLSYGALLPGDRIRLASSLRLTESGLLDTASSTIHRLRPAGIQAISVITGKPVMATSWLQSLLRQGLEQDEIKELLVFLNRLGAVSVNRPISHRHRKLIGDFRRLIYGSLPAPLAQRLPANLVGIAMAIAGTAGIPVILFLAVIGIAQAGKLIPVSVAIVSASACLVMLGSLVMHEVAHVAALRYYGQQPVLLWQGTRIGILHSKLAGTPAVITSLAGPLAGYVFCLGFFPAIPISLRIAMSLPHLCSLLPWYGDGRSLIRILSACPRTKFPSLK